MLAIVSLSCKKEDAGIEDQIIGKWVLTEKTVDNAPAMLSDCEKQSTIEFQVYNICLLYDGCTDKTTNSGWNYKDGMLNISKHLPAAYYIEQLDNASLKIRRNDISPSGTLQKTILLYVKI